MGDVVHINVPELLPRHVGRTRSSSPLQTAFGFPGPRFEETRRQNPCPDRPPEQKARRFYGREQQEKSISDDGANRCPEAIHPGYTRGLAIVFEQSQAFVDVGVDCDFLQPLIVAKAHLLHLPVEKVGQPR